MDRQTASFMASCFRYYTDLPPFDTKLLAHDCYRAHAAVWHEVSILYLSLIPYFCHIEDQHNLNFFFTVQEMGIFRLKLSIMGWGLTSMFLSGFLRVFAALFS